MRMRTRKSNWRRMRIWGSTSVRAFSSCLSSASHPSGLAWCPGIAAKLHFLVWAAFSSNHLVLGTFSSYLISPTKRQSSLCSWVKLWTDEKLKYFTKLKAVYVHKICSLLYTVVITTSKWNTKAICLPPHQAFHRPSGDPRAHEPDRSRICIRIM